MSIELLQANELPDGFNYPDAFIKVIKLEPVDIEPWYIMNRTEVIDRMQGMKERYPALNILPFARRFDNDDVACFLIDDKYKVQIVHDYASPGYEGREVYNSFREWFESAREQ